jgi:hypothetical protein
MKAKLQRSSMEGTRLSATFNPQKAMIFRRFPSRSPSSSS